MWTGGVGGKPILCKAQLCCSNLERLIGEHLIQFPHYVLALEEKRHRGEAGLPEREGQKEALMSRNRMS